MEEENRDEILIALDKLNQNQVATNNAITELNHYLIKKDAAEEKEKAEQKAEAEAKAQAEAEAKAENEEKEKTKEEENQTREAEEQEQQQEETQTYTELLQSIDDGITVQNGLIAGQFVTDGIICGVLLLTVLWNKLH